MQTRPLDVSPKDRSTAFFLFGFLLACYLLTFTGLIDSSDGLSMFATTESFVRTGSFDSNQLLWMGNQQGNIGVGGDLYSRKGYGMVLLAMPLVWLAKQWGAVGLVHAALLLNPLVTAWTGALLFRAGRRLGWSRPTSIATALLFGLATMAWPYTQGYFSDPICGWGLLAAAYALLAYAQSGRKLYLFGAGVAWGVAFLTRSINLITLPIYLLALFWVLDAVTGSAGMTLRERLRAAFWRNWRPVVSFFIPVVAAGLIALWWNWARYGSIFDTGYVSTESFTGDLLVGLYGLTIGPARGFIWYNPVLLLAIPGAIVFWRSHRRIFIFSVLLTALYVVVYAKWYMWHGGYSWGPRFLVPIVPFVSLVAGGGWDMLVSRRRWGWPGLLLAALLTTWSVVVQWLGLAVPFSLVQDWLAANVQPLFAPQTFTELRYSPLVLQWQFLAPQNIQFAWWQAGAAHDTVNWLSIAMPLAGVLAGLILLVQLLRSRQPDDRDDRARNWLYGGALIAITLAVLTYVQATLGSTTIDTASRRIADDERDGDAVLNLRPDQSQALANNYRGNLPVYGFFNGETLPPEQEAWLQQLRQRYTRLWVLPDSSPPEKSGWERALRGSDFLLVNDRISGSDNQRLGLFALAPNQELAEAGLGTVFGDPAAPPPVTEANGWFRLDGYAVTAEARPGDAVLLTLLWQDLAAVDENYQVFVHLLDEQGNKIEQADGQPVQWLRPTSTWQPGEKIADHYGLLLPATLPSGEYSIAVGLYHPVTGQRLPVSAGPSSYAIDLGPILVRQ
ncbi:MAG: hypothetical protein U0X20_03820 [Caldilineaceae bacterium]